MTGPRGKQFIPSVEDENVKDRRKRAKKSPIAKRGWGREREGEAILSIIIKRATAPARRDPGRTKGRGNYV